MISNRRMGYMSLGVFNVLVVKRCKARRSGDPILSRNRVHIVQPTIYTVVLGISFNFLLSSLLFSPLQSFALLLDLCLGLT